MSSSSSALTGALPFSICSSPRRYRRETSSITRPLAQAVEAVGEVVVTDGWSDWWYAKGERPEDALEALGLTDFLA